MLSTLALTSPTRMVLALSSEMSRKLSQTAELLRTLASSRAPARIRPLMERRAASCVYSHAAVRAWSRASRALAVGGLARKILFRQGVWRGLCYLMLNGFSCVPQEVQLSNVKAQNLRPQITMTIVCIRCSSRVMIRLIIARFTDALHTRMPSLND